MNLLKIVSVGLVSLALTATALNADARRLGGGKNSGKQQSSTMQRDSTPAAAPAAPAAASTPAAASAAKSAAPAAAAAPARNKWLGPLAGIAAGLGLAALASHLGFGAEFGNIMLMLLIGIVAMAAIGWFMARRRAKGNSMMSSMGNGQLAGAGAGAGYSAPNLDQNRVDRSSADAGMQRSNLQNTGGGFSGIGSQASGFESAAPAAVPELPAGFEIDSFLRNAKVYFLRLQAANDAANVTDIREFTTPEMFAELSLDIQERKGAKQHTEVSSVDTQFMGIETQGTQYVAGVKYTGLLSEDGATPAPFAEAWVLVKPVDGSSGWLLAGIEQVQ